MNATDPNDVAPAQCPHPDCTRPAGDPGDCAVPECAAPEPGGCSAPPCPEPGGCHAGQGGCRQRPPQLPAGFGIEMRVACPPGASAAQLLDMVLEAPACATDDQGRVRVAVACPHCGNEFAVEGSVRSWPPASLADGLRSFFHKHTSGCH